jgi:hypothetical protein
LPAAPARTPKYVPTTVPMTVNEAVTTVDASSSGTTLTPTSVTMKTNASPSPTTMIAPVALITPTMPSGGPPGGPDRSCGGVAIGP